MSVLKDLGQRLDDEGVGTLWTSIFVGPRPKTPDTCLTLQTYQGDPARLRDAEDVPADERLAVQVTARAENQAAAEALASAAYYALPFRHETLASGREYAWCRATSFPAFIGTDENNRPLVAFNVTLRRHHG